MLRILAAEDASAMQRFLAEVFLQRGHSIEIAGNGLEAVSKARRKQFDAIIMDLQMPVMNGLQATIAIRLLPDQKLSTVPILALTSHTEPSHAQACFDAGMDDMLIKPVSADTLVAKVEKLLRSPRASSPSRFFHPGWMPENGDPDPLSESSLASSHASFTPQDIETSSSQGEGVEEMHETSMGASETVDLVKNSHGIETVHECVPVRHQAPYQQNQNTQGQAEWQRHSGGSRSSETLLTSGHFPSQEQNPKHAAQLAYGSSSLFNESKVMLNLGADRHLVQILAGFFVESMPDLIEELSHAIHRKSLPDIERLAHSIRGLAATFSPAGILEAARRIEVCGRSGDLNDVEQLFHYLRQDVHTLTCELQEYCSESFQHSDS